LPHRQGSRRRTSRGGKQGRDPEPSEPAGRQIQEEGRRIAPNHHRGIVATGPIGALAHLQSGRAFVLCGDKAKAKTAYQDFLALWKDADHDIPIYRQAKAEYAKLRAGRPEKKG
jgi:hypothetical protein